ncbi:MAG: NUDIX hydrolase [Clostridia bacterium]|nr:NUDIX hydrolase [Clostridia bacterium]
MTRDKDLKEKTISSRELYHGRIINLKKDDVELPDGNLSMREYVEHPGGAAILAVDGEDMWLVRQFRYPYGEVIEEIPAGKLEKGEEAIVTAKRELVEEIGYDCDSIEPFGMIYPTPGYTNEHLYIFLAKGLKKREKHLDEDEFISAHKRPVKAVLDDIMTGKIKDGKTCYAVMKYCAVYLK